MQKVNLLGDSKSNLFDHNVKGKSVDRQEYIKLLNDHPSVVSRKEYLNNKAIKPSNVVNMKPEKAGMMDKRLIEKGFTTENQLS